MRAVPGKSYRLDSPVANNDARLYNLICSDICSRWLTLQRFILHYGGTSTKYIVGRISPIKEQLCVEQTNIL